MRKKTNSTKKIKKELRDQKALEACAARFDLVGDPTRLKICYLLCRHKELSVGEIARLTGVSISAVSHVLTKLKKADLVQKRREFRHVFYRIKASPLTRLVQISLKQNNL